MIRDRKDSRLITEKVDYNTAGPAGGDIARLTNDMKEVKRLVMEMRSSTKTVKFN